VLGWPAQQVADLLDTSVAAVNSALQRARATLAQTHGSPAPASIDSVRERRIVAEFVRAWHDRDIPALAALLRDDAILTMPPQAIEIRGRDAVTEFFATVPADGRLDLIRLVEIRANGQPAVAAYLPDDQGDCHGYGIMVLTLDGERVATITGFPDAALFPVFGLSAVR
jgi:RNA polymerase sigma-70 factor (ECF subfamily)